jgi:prepilin-type N-terminal cleavage/methylation domain-containing protein
VNDTTTRTGREHGFTLIELMIVIGIIAILSVVLLPNIFSAEQGANATATEATMLQLQNGCNAFERQHGYYPPADLKNREAGKTDWKADNGQNTGIESLVVFLSQSRQTGADLTSLADRLTNTDGDDHGAEIPQLGRRDRVEIADAWGIPLAYFDKFGMDKVQQVRLPEGDAVQVRARKRDDGSYYGAGKFQLLSAGQDGIFGNDDDLVWPAN